jgi:hypothetical protein
MLLRVRSLALRIYDSSWLKSARLEVLPAPSKQQPDDEHGAESYRFHSPYRALLNLGTDGADNPRQFLRFNLRHLRNLVNPVNADFTGWERTKPRRGTFCQNFLRRSFTADSASAL